MESYQARLEVIYDGTVMAAVDSASENQAGSSGDGNISPQPKEASYTVVKGDCLWSIAKRFYGNGAKYMTIYEANTDVIESTARTHGKANSYKGSTAGWWIWPGEILTIPGVFEEKEPIGTEPESVVKNTATADPCLGEKIAREATEMSYTDVASGQSDSVSITLQNIRKEWMGSLMPVRGAGFGVKIALNNYGNRKEKRTFDCGTFVLDDLSFSGRPLSCALKGVSVPAMNDFKSLPLTKTWEDTTIQEIASQIASKAGVSLYYDADTIRIAEIEQSKQIDSAFLYSLCEKYGLAMKVYNHKIVIFDTIRYEEKESVLTIKESDVGEWSFNITVEGTYTGVNLNYTDPDKDESVNVTMGSPGRMYAINTQASSRYDAELQAAAKVNGANRGMQTGELTMRANPKIVASHCVDISGFGNLDGKYYVDKVVHHLGNGYTMRLSIHKVQEAVKLTVPVPAASGTGGQTYTVVPGDTLWGISKKFYGSGTKYRIIYDANEKLIESTAKAHGRKGSDQGHWIWPGEIFVIPEG